MENSHNLHHSTQESDELNGCNESSLFVTNPTAGNESRSISKEFHDSSGFVNPSSRTSHVSGLSHIRPKTQDETTKMREHDTQSHIMKTADPRTPSFINTNPSSRADETVFSTSVGSINRNLSRLLRRLSCESEIDFQNSSFADGSEVQFDLDINLDYCKASKAPDEPSFWLACKSSSPQKFTVGQTQFLNQRKLDSQSVSDINSNSRVAELTKLLTNCKIQLRLYEKFLQDLIESHNLDAGDFEILHLQWQTESPSRSAIVNRDDANSPDKDIADISTLVEDLHASLEECQMKWKEADQRATSLDEVLKTWGSEVRDLLITLGCTDQIDSTLSPEEFLCSAVPLLNKHISRIVSQKVEELSGAAPLKEEFEKLKLGDEDFNKSEDRKHRGTSTPTREHETDYFRIPLDPSISARFKEYEERIDELQKEVNGLKGSSKGYDTSSTIYSVENTSKERITALEQELESAKIEYEEISDQFRIAQESYENSIKSLTNRFNSQKLELLSLRATAANFDNIQRELDFSMEKQRALTSEKIRLSYQVESLSKDKSDMQNRIDRLAEELQGYKLLGSPRLRNQEIEAGAVTTEALEDLFAVDVKQFQRLLTSFNKIADDKSLLDPTRKLDSLKPLRNKLHEQTPEAINFALGYHNSVFGFFGKAVDVIVKDHIKLLLKQEEDKKQYSSRTDQLMRRVNELESRLKVEKENVPLGNQLRIEELTSRWKAEREARVSESKAAQRRLNELRLENAKLG